MTSLYRIDKKMTDILGQGGFHVSAEVIPPRNGTPQTEVVHQLETLTQSGAEFLSVTKGAGGSLRGGSLPLAQVIKEHFQVPSIAHFTCRDLTPEECENQLMDHHYFGIRNILALRGDPPVGVDNWTPHPQSYPYAFQLIEQIKRMNRGEFLQRTGFQTTKKEQTDFCIGAACYPEEPDKKNRLEFFARKVEAGAQFAITQMIYSVESYSDFLEMLQQRKISTPILPGARILSTQAQALRMQDRFQIQIPKTLINSLPEKENPSQALEVFLKLVESFKKAGAPGLHIFVLTDTALAGQALKSLRK